MASDDLEQIKQRIDVAELISQYIPTKKAGRNFKANCPFHTEKDPSFVISPEKQIWHCFGCFPKKSLIKTEKGFHQIEKIKIGQKVLTHKGRYMPVVRSLWRPYKGKIIDIKIRKSNEKVSLTSDHEVYVIKTKNCIHKSRLTRICQQQCKKIYCPQFYKNYKIEKVAASDLSINDYLLYPINQEIKDIKFINLNKYYNRKITNLGPNIRRIPINIKVDEKFLKLIGYYIAEGSNHRAYIRFSLGNHEKKFAQEIKSLIKDIFKIKVGIHKRKGNRTGLEITACNSKLSNIFENLCGKGAKNKHIPYAFQYLAPKKQKTILEAIFKGDGYLGKISKCKQDRKYKSITTVSIILAEQIRDVLLRLRITPQFWQQKEKIDSNIHHQKSFVISWQENKILNFTHFYQKAKNGILYWLSPITEINERDFKGNVYNLTIAKDHSYMASNFVVGNCGKGGDIFTFLMEYEGIEFGDALKQLAEKAGVKLKPQDPKLKKEKDELYLINTLAAKFFHHVLIKTKAGKKPLDYLKKDRGLPEKIILEFQLGYAPDSWDILSKLLRKRNFAISDILKSGLVIEKDNNDYYDRFRNRITFPVANVAGSVVGFSGRCFDKIEAKTQGRASEPAKYINSPDTPIYNKSQIIYALDKAKPAIRKKDQIILVEGQMDVTAAHMAGFSNTVASSGTALTLEQINHLKKFSENLVFAFDPDSAGTAATKRAIDTAHAVDIFPKIIITPPGKDPADWLKSDKNGFKKALIDALGVVDYYLAKAKEEYKNKSLSPQDKRTICQEILPIIKNIADSVARADYLKKLANHIDIDEKYLLDAMRKTKIEPKIQEAIDIASEPQKASKKLQLEQRILGFALAHPQFTKAILKKIDSADFEAKNNIDIAKSIEKFYTKDSKSQKNIDLKKILSEDLFKIANIYILAIEKEFEDAKTDQIKQEIQFTLKQIRSFKLENIKKDFQNKIAQAEKDGDRKKIKELLKNLQKQIGI